MIRKDFSFLVFNHTGSPIKRFSFSRSFLTTSGCIVTAFFVGLLIFGTKYVSLIGKADKAVTLENQVVHREEIIDQQQEQIKTFAQKINELKSQLAELNKFEKKIRIIANLDNKENNTEGVFGIGGPMPEDLDPSAAMDEKQNSLLQDMHDQVKRLGQVAVSQQERFKLLYGHLEEQRNILACTPSIRPVDDGYISSTFGYRTSPFTGRKELHKGLDIAAKEGTPIIATADGVVSFAGKKGLLGNCIIIDNGYGITTRFGHASKLLKKRGDTVKRGDVIALIGNTGRSTGPHVHYEVRLHGIAVNPQRYVLN